MYDDSTKNGKKDHPGLVKVLMYCLGWAVGTLDTPMTRTLVEIRTADKKLLRVLSISIILDLELITQIALVVLV